VIAIAVPPTQLAQLGSDHTFKDKRGKRARGSSIPGMRKERGSIYRRVGDYVKVKTSYMCLRGGGGDLCRRSLPPDGNIVARLGWPLMVFDGLSLMSLPFIIFSSKTWKRGT
jgi:hypothetical protein